MVNKKLSRILGVGLGVMVFMSAIGVLEVPVLADSNVQANSTASANANNIGNKDYSININKSVTQNGYKITLDKAIATKHKLKVVLTIESDNIANEYASGEITPKLKYGDDNYEGSEGLTGDLVNQKTLKVTIDRSIENKEMPKKGNLKIELPIPKYNTNVRVDADVDFSESFEKLIEKNLSVKVPEFDYKINKLETDVLGTEIKYDQPAGGLGNDTYFPYYPYSTMILKADEKMYELRAFPGYAVAKAAIYDRIKDSKDIKIIPVKWNVNSWNESLKLCGESQIEENNKIKEADKKIVSNVSYVQYFKFSDGSVGEIYNIERNDNTLKVYCKGNSEKESLLMASNLLIECNNYDKEANMSYYKDAKTNLGYVVEFNNLEKNNPVSIKFNYLINKIEKFTIGSEVQISK